MLVRKADPTIAYRVEVKATDDDWGGPYDLTVSEGRRPVLDPAAKQDADEDYYRSVLERCAQTGNDKRLRRAHGWWAQKLADAQQYDEALKTLDKVSVLTAAMEGASSPMAVDDLMDRVIFLRHQGSTDQAKKTLEEALGLAEKVYVNDRPAMVFFLWTGSNQLRDLDDKVRAKAFLERALTLAQQPDAGDAARLIPRLWSQLGSLNEKLGDLTGAERANLASVSASEKVYGPHGDGTGVANFALCLFYWRQDRYAEAEKAGLTAVKIHEGGDSRTLLGSDLWALGEIYVEMGRNQEAEKTLKRAIEVFDERMKHSEASSSQSFSQALGSLGNLYNDLGRYREAQPLLERSVTLSKTPAQPERLFYDDVARRSQDYRQTSALENLASIYFWQEKNSQAEPLYRKVLEMREKAFPPDHPSVARSLGNVGKVLTKLGRPSEAVPLLERAVKIQEERFGADSPFVATQLVRLASAYDDLDRDKEAVEKLERALAIQDKKQPGTSAHATVLNDLTLHYKSQGRLNEARSMLERTLEINLREDGPDHAQTATTMQNLGTVEVALGNFARAEELELRALKIRTKVFGVPSPDVAFSYENLGWLYLKQKRYEKAVRYYREGLASFEATIGPDHPDTVRCRKNLADTLRDSGQREAADALAGTKIPAAP
jgi:tetratricopeptide (TPR) repeat protein